MKIGTENPKKVAVAVVLLLIGVFFLIRGFNSSSPESTVTGTPTALQPLRPGRRQPSSCRKITSIRGLRLDLLKNSEDVEYKGNGRNIFRAGAEPVKEIPKPVQSPHEAAKAAANTPPAAAAHQSQVFRLCQPAREESRVFLAQGDDVFVARQGDIVNRRYKILRITPTSVEVEDVISNARQTLPLTQVSQDPCGIAVSTPAILSPMRYGRFSRRRLSGIPASVTRRGSEGGYILIIFLVVLTLMMIALTRGCSPIGATDPARPRDRNDSSRRTICPRHQALLQEVRPLPRRALKTSRIPTPSAFSASATKIPLRVVRGGWCAMVKFSSRTAGGIGTPAAAAWAGKQSAGRERNPDSST